MLQHALDPVHQPLPVNRLNQVVINSKRSCPVTQIIVLTGSEKHERNQLVFRVLSDFRSQGQSIHRRHSDIGQHQIDAVVVENPHRLFTIAGLEHLVGLRKIMCVKAAARSLVLDDQYAAAIFL